MISASDHLAIWCWVIVFPVPKPPGTAAVPPLAMGNRVSRIRWPVTRGTFAEMCIRDRRRGSSCQRSQAKRGKIKISRISAAALRRRIMKKWSICSMTGILLGIGLFFQNASAEDTFGTVYKLWYWRLWRVSIDIENWKCNNFVIKFDKTGNSVVTYAIVWSPEFSVLFFIY